jgi:hypothetical protein
MKETVHLNRWLVPLLSLALLLGACASGPRAAQPNERQATARAMFQERCKKAGEFIHRRVEDVEGIHLLKLRPRDINYDDQFKLDDPYGRDLGGDGYISSFVRGSFHAGKKEPKPEGSPPRVGYLYVEAEDPKDGRRYRYIGRIEEPWQTNKSYLQGYKRFALDKTPASGPAPHYGVTYDDISTREEGEYWIAGSSLKVIDLHTNEVIAERIGYMVDWAQGSGAGGRSPWLFAADNACPSFLRNFKVLRGNSGPVFPSQIYQTLDFVEKVLVPVN